MLLSLAEAYFCCVVDHAASVLHRWRDAGAGVEFAAREPYNTTLPRDDAPSSVTHSASPPALAKPKTAPCPAAFSRRIFPCPALFRYNFRTATVNDPPPFSKGSINSFQLMLSKFELDGKLNPSFSAGPFELTIASIKVKEQCD